MPMRFLDWVIPWRKQLGNKSEHIAAKVLVSKGYTILSKNWACKLGELDIVARIRDTVVFVEVRSRSCDHTVVAAESVGRDKQIKLSRAANSFIFAHKIQGCSFRFDVIAIAWKKNSPTPDLAHHENAFEFIS
ncbi:YraN family protein [bacterium]|nr:YraN family protein [bacterium]